MENRIAEIRNMSGMTQMELAKKCGLAKGVIVKAEHMDFEGSNIRLNSLLKIAKGLEVPLSEILGIETNDKKTVSRIRAKRKRYILKRGKELKERREKALREING